MNFCKIINGKCTFLAFFVLILSIFFSSFVFAVDTLESDWGYPVRATSGPSRLCVSGVSCDCTGGSRVKSTTYRCLTKTSVKNGRDAWHKFYIIHINNETKLRIQGTNRGGDIDSVYTYEPGLNIKIGSDGYGNTEYSEIYLKTNSSSFYLEKKVGSKDEARADYWGDVFCRANNGGKGAVCKFDINPGVYVSSTATLLNTQGSFNTLGDNCYGQGLEGYGNTYLEASVYDPLGTLFVLGGASGPDTGVDVRKIECLCNDCAWGISGKNYMNSNLTFTIDSMDTICAYSGLEGNYKFRLDSDGNNYCEIDGFTVEWNMRKAWCELNPCGRGDYLDLGAQNSDKNCCSPREMVAGQAELEYTNEDCNLRVLSNTHLCYIAKNPSSGVISPGQWENANSLIGEIIYEGCGNNLTTNKEDGFEYVSMNQGATAVWNKCSSSGFDIQDTGKILTITGTDSQDAQKTFQYICIDRLAPRKNSIAVCRGSSNSILNYRREGGINAGGGESVNLSDNKVYFCTNMSTWSTDLDNYNLAGQNGVYCNNARHPKNDYGVSSSMAGLSVGSRWTGTYCCGEIDDWHGTYPQNLAFSVNNEYYNDDDRNPHSKTSSINHGACFNNIHQPNQTFLKIKNQLGQEKELQEVIVWHGTFQGCAIDSVAALEKKQDSSQNPGKVRQNIECALPNEDDTNKPYEGSFGRGPGAILSSSYGYSGTGNDFLLSLKDHPNPGGAGTQKGSLIHDNEYCNIKNISSGAALFCSYTEKWIVHDSLNPRTRLSFIPWKDDTVQQAECCTQDQCWNGSQCMPSIKETLDFQAPHKVMNNRGDGFVCKDGNWEWMQKKTNWDGTASGYCLENSQCLITPAGDRAVDNMHGPLRYPIDIIANKNMPACINDGEFYLDHYCENGTWTSRTKYAALQLYSLVGDNDFSLYCDKYTKVLNHLNYMLPNDYLTVANKFFIANPSSKCVSFTGQNVPCVNHVCVLVKNPGSDDQEVLFATSINHRINRSLSSGEEISISDFGTALGGSLSSCLNKEGVDDSFVTCSPGIYFNGKKSIVVLSRESMGSRGFLEVLYELFNNFITSLVSKLVNSQTEGFDYSLFQKLADDLYNGPAGTGYTVPTFICPGCVDNRGDGNANSNMNEVCGEIGNPRKIFDLNTIYVSRKGNKKIFGMAEYESDAALSPIRFNGIYYQGFDQDICESFTATRIPFYKCESIGEGQNKKDYVTAMTSVGLGLEISFDSLVDILPHERWVFLAPSNRLR
jgi:hypothetical protein